MLAAEIADNGAGGECKMESSDPPSNLTFALQSPIPKLTGTRTRSPVDLAILLRRHIGISNPKMRPFWFRKVGSPPQLFFCHDAYALQTLSAAKKVKRAHYKTHKVEDVDLEASSKASPSCISHRARFRTCQSDSHALKGTH